MAGKKQDTLTDIVTSAGMGLLRRGLTEFANLTDKDGKRILNQIAAHAIEQSPAAIHVFDVDSQTIDYVNPAFTTTFGYTLQDARGKTPRKLIHSNKHRHQVYTGIMRAIRAGNPWEGNITSRTKLGHEITLETRCTPILDKDGITTKCMVMKFDVHERLALEEANQKHALELERLAHTDTVTGIANSRRFNFELQKLIKQYSRKKNPFAVYFLDLDNFKAVNDIYGHKMGDRVLIDTVNKIKESIRARDGTLIARLGGDEFGIVAPVKNVTEATDLANRIMHKVSEELEYVPDAELSASMGITIYKGGKISFEELITQADTAMYEAKLLGKNRLHLFDDLLKQKLDANKVAENLSRLALKKPERIVPLYHAIYDENKVAIGGESLIALQDDEGNLRRASEFIVAAARSTGFVKLNWNMYETVVEEMENLFGEVENFPWFSVNMPKRMIGQENFANEFSARLKGTGIPHEKVVIELTERGYDHSKDALGISLKQLKDRGFKLAIDDFGTGHNNFDTLSLPANYIKIDHEITRNLNSDDDSLKKVSMVLGGENYYPWKVIFEGIENEKIMQDLLGLGASYFQGYHLAMPIPLEEYKLIAGQKLGVMVGEYNKY